MKAALESLVSPVAAACHLEVDRVEVQQAGRRRLIRIFLDGDGPQGLGPSLDDIATATKAISTALDASTLLGEQSYTLEVSSRGVSRPLTQPKHFRRNRGRLVHLSIPTGEVTGRIREVGASAVTLDMDGAELVLPLSEIGRAVVQVELNRITEDEES